MHIIKYNCMSIRHKLQHSNSFVHDQPVPVFGVLSFVMLLLFILNHNFYLQLPLIFQKQVFKLELAKPFPPNNLQISLKL